MPTGGITVHAPKGMTIPAGTPCPLCSTPMIVVSYRSYSMVLTMDCVGISCPRKYCGQNMIEREMYARQDAEARLFGRPEGQTNREICGR